MKDEFTTDMTQDEAEAHYTEVVSEFEEDKENLDKAQEVGSAAMSVENAKLKEQQG